MWESPSTPYSETLHIDVLIDSTYSDSEYIYFIHYLSYFDIPVFFFPK
jgi:hypothetical protein